MYLTFYKTKVKKKKPKKKCLEKLESTNRASYNYKAAL